MFAFSESHKENGNSYTIALVTFLKYPWNLIKRTETFLANHYDVQVYHIIRNLIKRTETFY